MDTPSNPTKSAPRILSVKQVCERVCLSRATIYLKVKSGEFPHPKAISSARIGWLESEVSEWITNRPPREELK